MIKHGRWSGSLFGLYSGQSSARLSTGWIPDRRWEALTLTRCEGCSHPFRFVMSCSAYCMSCIDFYWSLQRGTSSACQVIVTSYRSGARFKRVGGVRRRGRGAGGITTWATTWHSGRLLTASPLLPAPAAVSEKMARVCVFYDPRSSLNFRRPPLVLAALTSHSFHSASQEGFLWWQTFFSVVGVWLSLTGKKKKGTCDNPFQTFLWHCAHVAGQNRPYRCLFRKETAELMLSVQIISR